MTSFCVRRGSGVWVGNEEEWAAVVMVGAPEGVEGVCERRWPDASCVSDLGTVLVGGLHTLTAPCAVPFIMVSVAGGCQWVPGSAPGESCLGPSLPRGSSESDLSR